MKDFVLHTSAVYTPVQKKVTSSDLVLLVSKGMPAKFCLGVTLYSTLLIY